MFEWVVSVSSCITMFSNHNNCLFFAFISVSNYKVAGCGYTLGSLKEHVTKSHLF